MKNLTVLVALIIWLSATVMLTVTIIGLVVVMDNDYLIIPRKLIDKLN